MTLTQSSSRIAALTIGVAAIVAVAFSAAVAAPAHAAGICPGTTFNTNLKMGATSASVMALQQFLNMSADTQVAATGAGSPGSETDYFGALTKAAVNKFQLKYAAQILTPLGLTTPTGNFYAASQAEANIICSGSTSTGTGTGTGTTGAAGTATVSAAAQPANTIAPFNAARVPYTAFTVTANGAPVTVNSVSVVRQGPSLDTDFAGVVLIDASTGVQVGISRVLDANHSATIGSPITIPAGTSKTFWVAGNISATPGAGDIASFAVTSVNTASTVNGSFPITGASNTTNATLQIGSANVQVSSFDPNNSSSQAIGTTGYRFTGFRIQAGSVEDDTFKSITWYNSGSASGVQNVMTVVNGTSYPTTLDSTGRYYTTVFPSGIVIPKGQSLDVYVQGDLGANTTANTTAEFDVYRNTDIYITGNTYGFGITPTSPNTIACSVSGTIQATCLDSASTHATHFAFGTTQPFIQGSTVSVTAGTFSTIQNATSVGAQNVAINVNGQPLGGFQTNLTGEAITVQSLKIHFITPTAMGPLTNVSLVSSSGQVIAGPYNATCDTANGASGTTICTGGTGNEDQVVTFTGSILFPTGSNTYTIQGQVPSNAGNGSTIQAETNPSTDWSNVTGNTTGNNINTGVTNFTMNTMTVKGATLTIGNNSVPTSQTVVAGGSNVLFAGIQLDASQSGENVRLSSIPLTLTTAYSGTEADLSACQLFNGTTALNTGSRVFNGSQGPTGTTGQTLVTATTTISTATTYAINFSLDNSLTIPKGTVVTLNLQCNLSSSAANTAIYSFGTNFGSFSATGATSGNTVGLTNGGGNAPQMTVASTATLAVSTDSSSPSYAVVAGGTTGVTVNVLKFRATNEAVNLQKLGLKLNGSANSSDISNVYLYAGNNIMTTSGTAIAAGTLLGTASFTGGATTATSTLTNAVQLPNNLDATILVKVDVATLGTNQPAVSSDLIAVDYLNSQGTGANSGKTISGNVGGTTSAGIRIFKSYPIFNYVAGQSSASNGLNNLLTLTVSAPSNGEVQLNKLTFNIATTSSTLTLPTFSGPNGNVSSTTNSILNPAGTAITVIFDSSSNTGDRIIPAGGSKTYTLRANLSLTGNGGANGSVNVALAGDNAFATGTVATLNAGGSNIVWSPDTFGTSATTSGDWSNSYGLGGCYTTAGLGNACTAISVSK